MFWSLGNVVFLGVTSVIFLEFQLIIIIRFDSGKIVYIENIRYTM